MIRVEGVIVEGRRGAVRLGVEVSLLGQICGHGWPGQLVYEMILVGWFG